MEEILFLGGAHSNAGLDNENILKTRWMNAFVKKGNQGMSNKKKTQRKENYLPTKKIEVLVREQDDDIDGDMFDRWMPNDLKEYEELVNNEDKTNPDFDYDINIRIVNKGETELENKAWSVKAVESLTLTTAETFNLYLQPWHGTTLENHFSVQTDSKNQYTAKLKENPRKKSKNYNCLVCSKSFTAKSYLKAHTRRPLHESIMSRFRHRLI